VLQASLSVTQTVSAMLFFMCISACRGAGRNSGTLFDQPREAECRPGSTHPLGPALCEYLVVHVYVCVVVVDDVSTNRGTDRISAALLYTAQGNALD